MTPRILIVGTVPYNTKSTSRAFEAYFHGWPKENLAQTFLMRKRPAKDIAERCIKLQIIACCISGWANE